MLKILLGLIRPDAGRGTILGCDITRSGAELRRQVGYMPQSAAAVPGLRGVEFAALSGELYGMPRRDAQRRAHEVLNYVGLGELRYRQLEEYSTGNLQRLKLAAALIHDPRLLLLDEPTNGLDPSGRLAMLELLEDLIAETGKSVILCTHLLGDAERLCHQLVVLDRGQVVRSGPMRNVRSALPGRFVLDWQGDGSRFVAQLEQAGATCSNERGTGRLVASVPATWNTTTFFQLARQGGVVLTHLAADEESLERLFFRITELESDVQPAPLAGDAHGH